MPGWNRAMGVRLLVGLGLIAAPGLVVLAGQARQATTTSKSNQNWTPPHTPWGEPDLRGVFDNGTTTTPWERPAGLGLKDTLSGDEVTAAQKAENELVAKRESGKDFVEVGRPSLTESPIAGNEYNAVWLSEGRPRTVTNRTSLVVDPPNGRIPYRPELGKRLAYKQQIVSSRPPDDFVNNSWLDRDTGERCLTDGLAGVMGPQGYNSHAQIFQSPGWVVIVSEMYHEFRTIPTDGRPHPGSALGQWWGHSVGHWEGNTLVVETTNFADKTSSWWQSMWRQASPTLRLTERFASVGPNTIAYKMTVEDPATFTQPWTADLPLERTTDLIYEFACHEGNYAMSHLLGAARAAERAGKGGTQ